MTREAERRPGRDGVPDDDTASVAEALGIARSLAAAGIPVFVAYPDPAKPGDYKPPKRWQTTTANPAYAGAWETGLALCAVMGHGADLVDVDPRNGGELRALDGVLPEVLGEAVSPSGGTHLFVRSMDVRSRDGVLPGIDVKAGDTEGRGRGFAFIAPTVRKSKVTGEPAAYRWTRAPDLSRLGHDASGQLARLVRQAHLPGSGGTAGAGSGWTDPDIDALVENGIGEGNQDSRLRDVVWALCSRGTSKPVARAAWQAIVARTQLLRPEQPWTSADFERHWEGAARKLAARPFTQPGSYSRGSVRSVSTGAVSDTVSDKINAGRSLTSQSDTSDTSDSTTGEQLLAGVRDGAWLTTQQFPPLRFAVPGLIPEGFTLLIGAPKIGKSWLALDLLLGVAAGGAVLGTIAPGAARAVFYLALEDSDRRMQDRCRALLGDGKRIPPRLSYATRVGPGLVLATIGAWMERSPDTALVVVDTLGKVMPPAMQGESAYQRDYRIGSAVKSIADTYPGLAIVVCHHDRKASADDFIDSVSGTHGLAGAADTIAVLGRRRQSDEGLLKITGRDIAENEYALTLHDGKAWQLDGATLASAAAQAAQRAAAMNLSATSADVVGFVNSHPEGVHAKDVTAKFGKDAYQYLGRLVGLGQIDKAGRGFYTPIAVSEVSEPSEPQVSDTTVSDTESDTVRNCIGPGCPKPARRACSTCYDHAYLEVSR